MRVRLMTSSPTAFIMRSRRSREMRTDLACGNASGAGRRFSRAATPVSAVAASVLLAGADCGWRGFFGFFGSEFSDLRQERIHGGAHFVVAGPLAVQEFLQDIYGLQANVHDIGAGLQDAIAQAADEIFNAMRNSGEPMQIRLARRSLSPCAWSGKGG